MSEIKHESTTMYKKHKWFSGLRSFLAFNQLRQICDLTVCLETLNLCQNANLARCKLTSKSFEITYVSYTNRCTQAEKTTQQYNDCRFEKEKNGKSQPTKARVWQPIPATVPSLPNTCFFCQRTHFVDKKVVN